MATTVSFANGETFEIISAVQGREYISGSERDFLEITFNADTVGYDTVKSLYINPDNFETVQYTEPIGDGISTIDYSGYTTPVNIISKNENNVFTITLKIARKTDAELVNEELTKKNKEIQLALVELGNSYAELEERLNKLEGIDGASNDSATEEG